MENGKWKVDNEENNCQLPEGWEVKKLGEVCEYDKQQGQFNNHIYVGLEDIESNTGEFIGLNEPKTVKSTTFKFSKKHLLYGRLRPYLNKVLVPNFEGHCSTEIFPIKVNGPVDRQFLARWLMQEKTVDKINYTCTGARMPRANMKEVLNFQILVPPLPEQKRIVAILDKAFAAIAKAKANAEQNLKNAKELFESYLQGVFENKGEGWEEKTLGEVCHFVRGPFGGSLKKSCFKKDGNAVYEQQHAIYNQFNEIRYFVDDIKFEEMKRFELLAGDLIMSCSGTMGKVAVVPKNIKKGIINQALLKLTPSNHLNVEYLKYWMTSNVFQKSLAKYTVGAAIKNVASVKILKQIATPLPSLPEQKIIVQKIDVLSAKTKKLEAIYQQKIEDLEKLKKSVLQKAFNGEL